MFEKEIQEDIRREMCRRPAIRVFRNNNGVAYMGRVAEKTNRAVLLENFRMVRFGLMPDSSDLIGWKSVTVTPDMVGKKVAVFLSIEVKQLNEKPTAGQQNWINQVNCAGGIAFHASSVTEVELRIDNWHLN